MRGKVGFSSIDDLNTGITPAYAGKRLGGTSRRSVSRDHPRVCGEKTKKIP